MSNPLIVGKTVQLKVAEGDEECQGEPTDKPWAWSSENPSVASVSPNGVITAIAPGKFRILARSQSKSSQPLWISGIIYPAHWTVRMQPETATIKAGDRVTFAMVTTDSKGNLLPSMPVLVTTPDYRQPATADVHLQPDSTPVSSPWLDRSFHGMGSTLGTFRAPLWEYPHCRRNGTPKASSQTDYSTQSIGKTRTVNDETLSQIYFRRNGNRPLPLIHSLYFVIHTIVQHSDEFSAYMVTQWSGNSVHC